MATSSSTRQEDEVEALEAIFGDDFTRLKDDSPWKLSQEQALRKFSLKLGDGQLVMTVTMPKTYPNVPPLLKIKSLSPRKDLEMLQTSMEELARSLVGSEMIYEIAQLVQDWIPKKEVVRPLKQVSLGEELVQREQLASDEVKEEAIKENRARDGAFELLSEKLSEEIAREQARKKDILREQKRKEKKDGETSTMVTTSTTPQSAAVASDGQVLMPQFGLLILGPAVSKTHLETQYLSSSQDQERLYTIKRTVFSSPFYCTPLGRKQIQEIENDLEVTKSVRSTRLCNILDYKIERQGEKSCVLEVLTDREVGVSVSTVLEQTGGLPLAKAMAITEQVLIGLQELHSKSIFHRRVNADTVLLHGSEVRLTGPSYLQRLVDLDRSNPVSLEMPAGHARDTWMPPESRTLPIRYSQKYDLYQTMCLFLQILHGTKFVESMTPLDSLHQSELSHTMTLEIEQALDPQPRRRPSISDLLKHFSAQDPGLSQSKSPATTLRDLGPLLSGKSGSSRPLDPLQSVTPALNPNIVASRYASDFEEVAFLGKGGYGKVVKARNVLDGQFYAVKKIKMTSRGSVADKKILREVMTLSRLQSPYVVRYYTTWLENEHHDNGSVLEEQESSSRSELDPFALNFPQEGDFLSTSGAPRDLSFGIDFTSDSDDGLTDVGDAGPHQDRASSDDQAPRPSNVVHSSPATLYIAMEFCENRTLRDAIDQGLAIDTAWRNLRQMIEGLAHIASLGIIHRDLKPTNVFLDRNGDVKIGDFGLATSSAIPLLEDPASIRMSHEAEKVNEDDMTSEVGTSLYVAPEILSKSAFGTNYTQKVDIYSLGIIWLEMLTHFKTVMERVAAIRDVRRPELILPANFTFKSDSAPRILLEKMLQHDPKSRPSAFEILKSDLLPALLEDEYIQEAMRLLGTPGAPHYSTLINNLMTKIPDRHQEFTYDFNSGVGGQGLREWSLTTKVCALLTRIFRAHGAVQIQIPFLIPKTEIYENTRHVVRLLDSQGLQIELPYDLTTPFARYLSRSQQQQDYSVGGGFRRFAFGNVFRQNVVGGQPRAIQEADFDIVQSVRDLSAEAEVIKVLDTMLDTFPSLENARSSAPTPFAFYMNHSILLNVILSEVPIAKREMVSNLLSQLDRGMTMAQFRSEMFDRGVPKSVVEEMQSFRDPGEIHNVCERIAIAYPDPDLRRRVEIAREELSAVTAMAQAMGVRRPILLSPLLIHNLNLYKENIFFQLSSQVVNHRRDVIAAGGRYDALIRRFQIPSGELQSSRRSFHFAVGTNIAFEKLLVSQIKYEGNALNHDSTSLSSRLSSCDVLVTRFGNSTVEERCDLIKDLWARSISAEMGYESLPETTLEMVTSHCRDHGISWLVFLKHRAQTGREHVWRILNVLKRTEEDVGRLGLLSFLQTHSTESARRDDVSATGAGSTKSASGLTRSSSSGMVHTSSTTNVSNGMLPLSNALHVQVVVPNAMTRRIKRKEKEDIVKETMGHLASFSLDFSHGQVQVYAIIDLGSAVFGKMASEGSWVTSDDGFKRVLEATPASQRNYLHQIRELLRSARQSRPGPSSWAFLYSWKDGRAILVSLV